MTEKPSVDNWDDFAGDYLKAEYIKSYPAVLVVINVETEFDEDKAKLIAVVEYNEKEFKFQLNKTNQAVVKKICASPKELIGKKLTVQRIKQRNPATNSLVDSILIDKIE